MILIKRFNPNKNYPEQKCKIFLASLNQGAIFFHLICSLLRQKWNFMKDPKFKKILSYLTVKLIYELRLILGICLFCVSIRRKIGTGREIGN